MAVKVSASVKERQKILAQRAKEKEKEEAEASKTEICWHCRHKVWRDYQENRDPDGIPITLDCPFRKPDFGHILRTEKACEHFSKA